MSFQRILASVLVAALSVQAAPSLKIALSGPPLVNGADSFTVKATIINNGDSDLSLFNDPRGLLSPLPTRSFKLAKSANPDEQPEFIGAVAKYTFGAATSFTELKQGENITIEHQLSRAFAFSSAGDYDVTPVTRFFYKASDGTPTPLDAEFDQPHTAKLSGSLKSEYVERRKKRWEEKRSLVEEAHVKRSPNPKWNEETKRAENSRYSLWKRTTNFANCTTSQETQIQNSAYIASLYVADAEKYLTLNDKSTPRFETWFGAFEEDHRSTVLTHYSNIRKSDVKTYTYDCACEEGDDVYAYVYPTEFGHIYLCGQYMAAPLYGTDSKAGTIVHESSHFIANAGTEDIAYGHERAQALAISNSTEAINNADSHEYFAENTPYNA